MPTPTEAGRALLELFGVPIPPEVHRREDVIEGRTFDANTGEQLTGPPSPAAEGSASPPGRCCDPLAGADPDLLDEILEAKADALLFSEDW